MTFRFSFLLRLSSTILSAAAPLRWFSMDFLVHILLKRACVENSMNDGRRVVKNTDTSVPSRYLHLKKVMMPAFLVVLSTRLIPLIDDCFQTRDL